MTKPLHTPKFLTFRDKMGVNNKIAVSTWIQGIVKIMVNYFLGIFIQKIPADEISRCVKVMTKYFAE